jgi:hypothetical protein
MYLPSEGDEKSGWKPAKPSVFLSTPANELQPMFSPFLTSATNRAGPLRFQKMKSVRGVDIQDSLSGRVVGLS